MSLRNFAACYNILCGFHKLYCDIDHWARRQVCATTVGDIEVSPWTSTLSRTSEQATYLLDRHRDHFQGVKRAAFIRLLWVLFHAFRFAKETLGALCSVTSSFSCTGSSAGAQIVAKTRAYHLFTPQYTTDGIS